MNMKINGFWELLYRATEEEKEAIIAYMKDGLSEEGEEDTNEV